MEKVPYLSQIAEMVQFRAARALINGHVPLFHRLNAIQEELVAMVESGGDGQTNGDTGG